MAYPLPSDMAYPLPSDTAYPFFCPIQRINSNGLIRLHDKEFYERTIYKNTGTEPNLSITSNNINIELNKEFLEELQKNTYHGWIDEDVVNHIAKVLEMVDLIHVPGMDSHQLRMKIFPLSLTCNTLKSEYAAEC
ncbi:hypothetical protein Tco_1041809 [Tanacetum coccineum]|uniref:Uncharacterized protein n=1 Tax=Tanacetum coccineum TaxID=301880 RepID=A0ABQ5GHZ2_9ASTR